MLDSKIPYPQIETLFLDVGNTLVSMDFALIGEKLGVCGVSCSADEVRRAEAKARPAVSAIIGAAQTGEKRDIYTLYLTNLLANLPQTKSLEPSRHSELAATLKPMLEAIETQRLWSFVLPGVREALEGFWQVGMQLVAVSNSDGTVERGLVEQDLRRYFAAVIDSHVVGFAKPDPRIFHLALQISGATPANTLHVGDIYHVDVIGARAAGLHALLLDPFDDWQDVDCERVAGLLQLFGKISGSVNG